MLPYVHTDHKAEPWTDTSTFTQLLTALRPSYSKQTWCLTSTEIIWLIRDGAKGVGRWAGELKSGVEIIYLSLHSHHQNGFCMRWAAMIDTWVSLIERNKVKRQCPQTTTYLKRKENRNGMGGGDSSVVRAPDSWLKGRGFESLLERRENFLLQGRLSVLTLTSVSVPPPCYHSST